MFLALRSLVFQRGRYALIGLVIGLLALLTMMLSGLSVGLVNDGVSGLKSLPATAFAFESGTKADNAFSRSAVDDGQRRDWQSEPGIAEAELFGVSLINARTAGGQDIDLSLFGFVPGGFLEPEIGEGSAIDSPAGIVLSATAREDGVAIGDTITLDRVDTELEVMGFTPGQATFGHVDVGYVPLATWQYVASGTSSPGQPDDQTIADGRIDTASVVALRTVDGHSLEAAGVDVATADSAADTTMMTLTEAFGASPGYTAETTTISLIQGFLYIIAALVIGAFFTVWTVQRQHELAVLRAVGASTGFLLRDGIMQAAVLLVTFTGVGVAAGASLAALMPAGVPFSIEAGPVAGAALLMITLGLVGAALAVLRIARIEPATALGGNR
ncbi:ABC transporter permease [Demequina sp. SO4-18]|uniref:ABC transporter permease n=1 Tax=Demequina sp. SO4-18 TaxID=3401026 RepID=UPI003B5A8AB2